MVVTVIDAERSLAAALTDRRITDRDAAAVRDFLADSRATKGISANRINLYASSLCRMARFLPAGLLAASAADLYAGIAALRGPTAKDGERPYKQNTLQSTITIVRLFYWWAVENGYSEIPVQRIDRLKPPKRDQMTKTAGQMLTPEEVRAIAGACRTSRDRAMLAVLYEGALRPIEVYGRLPGETGSGQMPHSLPCRLDSARLRIYVFEVSIPVPIYQTVLFWCLIVVRTTDYLFFCLRRAESVYKNIYTLQPYACIEESQGHAV